MKGEVIASKYALSPNSFGYCGSTKFGKTLSMYLSGKGSSKQLKDEIMNFRVHYAYLRLIARENGRRPFDEDVVRAFWTGNVLLEKIRPASLRRFIIRDLFEGKDPPRAKALASNLPAKIVPHHSFNALYVNFVTGKVARSVRNFDSCCITPAKILSVGKKKARVLRKAIVWSGTFALRDKKDTIDIERSGIRLAGPLKKGDIVSVHWGMAVEKLSKKNLGSLLRYTKRNLAALKGGKTERRTR
jgi:hypothetical protein